MGGRGREGGICRNQGVGALRWHSVVRRARLWLAILTLITIRWRWRPVCRWAWGWRRFAGGLWTVWLSIKGDGGGDGGLGRLCLKGRGARRDDKFYTVV
eukprot:scaffold16752_cov85-Cyclotella_meneghiniana.AAC.3